MTCFIKKPHSAIICGATDCGKTEFTLNLLETKYKDIFKYIVIVCPTWRYNKTYLRRKSKDPLNDTLKVFF